MLLRFQRNLGSRNRHKKRVFDNGHVRDLSSLTCHCYGMIQPTEKHYNPTNSTTLLNSE